jgi:hypothetical protein
MARPHSACWIIAAAAMIILMSPSPAGVSVREPAAVERPAVRTGLDAIDPALGPWRIEQMLLPYPVTVAPERLLEFAPRLVIPAVEAAQRWPGPVDSALGPWRVERFLCPYSIIGASARLPEPSGRLVEPKPAPAAVDPALGPWRIEQMLLPYPTTVAPDRLPEFVGPLVEPRHSVAPADGTRRAHVRLVMSVAGTARKLLSLVDHGAHAARRAMKDLTPPTEQPTTTGGQAATSDRGVQAMPAQIDDAGQGLKQLLEALDAFAPPPRPGPADDGQSFLLPWREVPQTASDPFALEQRWTDADVELPIARASGLRGGTSPPSQHYAALDRIFPQSTGVAFLAALLLIPLSCSYAAGAVYGYARDGPVRQ